MRPRWQCGNAGLTAGKAGRFTYSAGNGDALSTAKWARHDYCERSGNSRVKFGQAGASWRARIALRK
jgi:hypothetical protein